MPTTAPTKKKPATKAAAPKAKKTPPPAPAIPIPAVATAATTYPVELVPTDKVHISVHNTRQPTLESVRELIQSIASGGQSTAAIARPFPGKPGHFELAAGARRRTACHALGIPLRIEVRPLTDGELQDLILTENLQREDPDPFAEAALIDKRLKEGADPETIAALYGKDGKWVRRRTKLLGLIPKLKARLTTGDLQHYSLPMAELLGTLPEDIQKKLNENDWTLHHRDSLSELQAQISQEDAKVTRAILKTFADPRTDNPAANCCGAACAHSTHSDLFADLQSKNDCAQCLNTACFFARRTKAHAILIDDLTKDLDPATRTTLVFFKDTWNGPDVIHYGDKEHKIHRKHALDDYNFHLTPPPVPKKKKDDSTAAAARPALDFTAPDRPTLVWLTLKPSRSVASTATPAQKARVAIAKAAKADGQKLTEDEITAAVRRQNHQRKRWKEVHTELCNTLEKLQGLDLTYDRWLALFIAFGSNIRRESLYSASSKTTWGIYHKTDPTAAPSGPLAQAFAEKHGLDPIRLFKDHFHDLFQSRLKFVSGMENFDDNAELRLEMTHIAKLIGFDLTAAKKRADLALPPPKSLGKVDPHTLLPLT